MSSIGASRQVWVIYDHPRDFPDAYLVRAWHVESGEEKPIPSAIGQMASTLEEARMLIPDGAIRVGRHPDDDPTIAEVWI